MWSAAGQRHKIPSDSQSDAMMLDRPYRQGLPWARVVAELRAGAGTQFDPSLIEPFIAATSHARGAAAS